MVVLTLVKVIVGSNRTVKAGKFETNR